MSGKAHWSHWPHLFQTFWGFTDQFRMETNNGVYISLYTQLNAYYISCVLFNWIENLFCFGSHLPPLHPRSVRKGQSSMAWMEIRCHFGTCTHLAWQVVTGGEKTEGEGETGVDWGASEHECTVPENQKNSPGASIVGSFCLFLCLCWMSSKFHKCPRLIAVVFFVAVPNRIFWAPCFFSSLREVTIGVDGGISKASYVFFPWISRAGWYCGISWEDVERRCASC